MRTTDSFLNQLESFGAAATVVVSVGGEKMAAQISMVRGDYVTLTVDKAVLTGNGAVGLSDVPNGRSTQIEVPIAAISWIGRAPRP